MDDEQNKVHSPALSFGFLMWCPSCKIKSPTAAVGTDELICAQCNTEIVPSVPRPKSRSVRNGSKRKGEKVQSLVASERKPKPPTVERSPNPAIQSAQGDGKTWSDASRKWRSDKAHLKGHVPESEHLNIANQSVQPQHERAEVVYPSRAVPGYHLILFGVFVFLAGHVLTIWAFLAGHFGAWTIGSFCSVGGVTIAIVSVVQALRDLQTQVAESNSSVRKVRKVKRVKRKTV